MRRSVRATRNRILALATGVLISGSALAAAVMPAQAVSAPASRVTVTAPSTLAPNTVTVTAPATVTSAAAAPITPLAPTATDSDPTLTTFTWTAAGLPPGLTINPDTGVISGTPAAADVSPIPYTVVVTATDATDAAGFADIAWTIAAAANKITFPALAAQSTKVGLAVTGPTIKATDSDATATLTYSSTTLPPGLTVNAAGKITGAPTTTGTYPVKVTATDGTGATATSKPFDWVITASDIIADPGAQKTTAGQWKLLAPLKAKDYVPGDKPTYTATGLPAGMAFQGSTLLFYGWPTTAGSYTVTVREHGTLGSNTQLRFKLTVVRAADKGASGQIHLALDGKCLSDPGGKTANGTKVRFENCVSGATEKWTVVSDGTIRVNGRCLDIAGTAGSAGRQLQLTSCGNGNPRQLWTRGSDGELVNSATGLCVTDPGSSKASGTVPTMGGCRAKSYEQWTLPAQSVLTAIGGSCLDDHFSVGTNGAVTDMFWCNQTAGQTWTFNADGTIRAGLYGSKCLTIRNHRSVLWACGASGNQKWTVVRTSSMGSELTEGGVCLAIPGMTSAKGTKLEPNGTQLTTSTCSNADPRDLWHIS